MSLELLLNNNNINTFIAYNIDEYSNEIENKIKR
jgi:hypothetical protein